MFSDIINFISSVGFPIAMCVLFFLEVKELEKSRKEETKSNTESITSMANAIENNTAVVTQLTTVISQYLPVIIQSRNNKTDNESDGY